MSTSALNLDPEELKRNLAITLGTQGRVLPEHLGMPSEPQMAGPIAPAQGKPPDLAIAQPSVKGPRGTLDADKAERSRLLDTGSGISQIYNKVTNSSFGQNHPLAGKILGGLGEGAATLGNIGLSAVAPQVSAMIPGTQEHHQLGLRQINRQIGNEEGEQEKEAQTAHEQAATEQIKNPPDKYAPLPTEQGYQAFDARKGEVKPLTGEGGQPLTPYSPVKEHTIDEQAYDSLVKQGKTPVEALDTIYGAKNTKTEDLPHLYLDALQAGDAAKAALIKRAHEDTQVKPVQPPGVTMIVPNGDGGGTVQRIGVGGTVAPGAQTAAGVNTVNTPTMTQRTAAGRAQTVVEMAPEVLGRIDAMAPKLGPIEGRWGEFMQGKVGMDNPDFSALRSDLLMLSSAVALAHAQGRLPENLREEFDRAINAPKQTAANLKATIQTMIPWLQKVQQQGQGGAKPQGGNTNDPLGIR